MPVHIPMVIAHRGASAAHPENTVAAFVGARDAGRRRGGARRPPDRRRPRDRPPRRPAARRAGDRGARRGRAPGSRAVAGRGPRRLRRDGREHRDQELAGRSGLRRHGAGGRRRSWTWWPRPAGATTCSCPPSTSRRSTGCASSTQGSRPPSSTSASTARPRSLRRSSTATARCTPGTPSSAPTSSAAAHELGIKVNTWTVDDPDRMLELAGFGIDGIVTNVPDLARETLGARP